MAKILVVEDDDMIREMLTRFLSMQGYEVITAINGVVGLQTARADRPDLILMDMGLPLLSGWQVTARIRADESLAHIPVIALTAFAFQEDRDRALEAGCTDYEPKPVVFSRLLSKIAALLANVAA
jgi:two-component system, cell cycle response regulator DivK